MIKFNHLWYLLHICCDFAIIVNPFFRAVPVHVEDEQANEIRAFISLTHVSQMNLFNF